MVALRSGPRITTVTRLPESARNTAAWPAKLPPTTTTGDWAHSRASIAVAGVAPAKATVSAFIESLGLRPLDVGELEMARWLEGVGLLLMGLARHGMGSFNIALGVNLTG